ncbi:MAG: LytTR family DNA-binding domain-containing protein [Anaerorhabdus sp.]
MKVKFEINDNSEDEVVINCSSITSRHIELQKIIEEFLSEEVCLEFYNEETEYYFPLKNILFFEASGNSIYAHTEKEVFKVKYKMYELEKILPDMFMRVAKSLIVNVDKIYSIKRNLSSSSIIEFLDTNKKGYVSRGYYSELKVKVRMRQRRKSYEK